MNMINTMLISYGLSNKLMIYRGEDLYSTYYILNRVLYKNFWIKHHMNFERIENLI